MRMEHRPITKLYIIAICALLFCIGIGYSSFNTTLKVNGTTTVSSTQWSLQFNSTVTVNNTCGTSAVTRTNGTTITFNADLTQPGDHFKFTAKVENKGTIPAKLSSYQLKIPSGLVGTNLANAIKYNITLGGNALNTNNNGSALNTTIAKNSSTDLVVDIYFDNTLSASALTTALSGLTTDTNYSGYQITLNYVQA